MSLHLGSLRHDVRLMYQLRSYELRHFLILLDYAGERRDPTFIPAKKREEVRLIMGFGSGDKSRVKLDARLRRFEELGLIHIYDDNSFLVSFLVDQEDEEDERPPVNAFTERRLPAGRAKSTSDSAVRKADYRRRQAEAGEGPARRRDEDGNPRSDENRDISGESVPLGESKCPTVDAEMSHAETRHLNGQMSQNERDIPRAREDVRNVVGDLKNSYTSDNVSYVGSDKTETPNVPLSSGQSFPSGQSVPPSSQSPSSQFARPTAPPPRPPIRPQDVPLTRQIDLQDVPLTRQIDLREVSKLTGDDPKWRPQWKALWNHCYSQDKLVCWDQGFSYVVWRQRVSPASGPGSVGKPAPLLRGTILALLKKVGAPYVPVSRGEAPPEPQEEPADPEEAARVHQEVLDIKAGWEAEEKTRESARRRVITPLEEPPEFEDTPRYEEDE